MGVTRKYEKDCKTAIRIRFNAGSNLLRDDQEHRKCRGSK